MFSNAVSASIAQAAAAGTITDDDQAASILSGQVTELIATATVNKVTLTWTAPFGTILGYRIEASYDGGTVWAEVEDNTNGTSIAYAHGSGLMAGETRDYRVSAAPYRVKVDYATSDGTATAGSDYTATSGALIIRSAGDTRGTSAPGAKGGPRVQPASVSRVQRNGGRTQGGAKGIRRLC